MGNSRLECPNIDFYKSLGYKNWEVGNMEWSIKCLFEKIKNNNYDVIISDDIGGRVPSIVLKKLFQLQGIYLPILFIMGGEYMEENGNISRHLIDTGVIRPDSHVLLVTQMVDTGDTLKRFSDILEGIGVMKADFGTLDTISRNRTIHDRLELSRTGYSYHTGDWVDNPDDCHHRFGLGVARPNNKQLHPAISATKNKRVILQGDVNLLCHRIMTKLVENKNPQMRSYAGIDV